MLKKILITILTLYFVQSCSASKINEEKKSKDSVQRSGRINSSESNTKDIFKELDQ